MAIRSRFTPDRIDAREGDELIIHVTNVEETTDMIHGFAIVEHDMNVVLDPGETKTIRVKLNKAGVFPFYCTNFCSALHPSNYAMRDFLRREIFFLRRPLNLFSRILLLAAAGLLVAAAFLPLWKIHLVAPQYREGLALNIYSYQLIGGNGGQDLHEINTLNHYIGMKTLSEVDFAEMKWMPFALGVFVILALRAAVIGRMASVIDLGVLFLYFTLFSLGNFYYRLHSYGHSLDPTAPMSISPFTPVVIGSQKIANFIQTSLPQTGGYLLAAFLVLIFAAGWNSRREVP